MTRVLFLLSVCWSTLVFAELHQTAAQVATAAVGETPTGRAEKEEAEQKLQSIFYYAIRDKKWEEIRDIIRQPKFNPNFKVRVLSNWNDATSWIPLFKILIQNGQFDLALELAKLPGFDLKERGSYHDSSQDRVIFFQDKIIQKVNPPKELSHALNDFLLAAFDQSRPASLGAKEKELFEIILKDKIAGDFDPTGLSNVTDPYVMQRILETKPDLSPKDQWGKTGFESTRQWLNAKISQHQTLKNIVGEISEREKKIEGMKKSLALFDRYEAASKKKK